MVSFGIFGSGQWRPRSGVGSAHTSEGCFLRSGVLWLVESSELNKRALVVEGRLEISATILSSEGGCDDGGLGGESGACVA